MSGARFTLAALAVLLLITGCAQRNEEDVRTGETLSRMLKEQSILIEMQDELTARLGGRWDPLGLSRFIRKELDPATEEAIRESSRNIEMGAREEAADLTQSAEDLQEAGGQASRMLQGFLSANTAHELIDGTAASSSLPPTPLGPIREDAESVGSESLILEEQLLRSAEESAAAFSAIRAGLENTGSLDDQANERIDRGVGLAERLKEDSGLAVREFGNQLERYLSNMLETIEGVQAARLPDGACAVQPVGYPSTLGEPSVYVYVFNGVTCEFGKQLALSLFSDSTFRETGSGYSIPPETGPLPEWAEESFMCELGQVSPIGEPRMVLCFPEGETDDWAAPRVTFEAPSTAG